MEADEPSASATSYPEGTQLIISATFAPPQVGSNPECGPFTNQITLSFEANEFGDGYVVFPTEAVAGQQGRPFHIEGKTMIVDCLQDAAGTVVIHKLYEIDLIKRTETALLDFPDELGKCDYAVTFNPEEITNPEVAHGSPITAPRRTRLATTPTRAFRSCRRICLQLGRRGSRLRIRRPAHRPPLKAVPARVTNT